MLPHQGSHLISKDRRLEEHTDKDFGLLSLILRQPKPKCSKVVFLNKENLELLLGYKVTVKIYPGISEQYDEIHIVLTGKSAKGAKELYEQLKPLPLHEIYSDQVKRKSR
jgi:hypothetical protein